MNSILLPLLLALPVYSQFYFIVPPPPAKNNTYEYNQSHGLGQELNNIWKGRPTDYISKGVAPKETRQR
jgi:hypothetical protein